MKTRFRSEDDDWSPKGQKINSSEHLETISRVLEEEGPIVMEHWFYRGSSAPDRLIFDDVDDFKAYLEKHAWAGDLIQVWSFLRSCTDENQLVSGKCPDDAGRVPRKGAY